MGFIRNFGNKLRTLPVNALPKNIINFITKRIKQQQEKQKQKLYNLGAGFEIAKLIKYDSVQLPHDKFLTISGLSNAEHMRDAVKEILIPRVVATDGHQHVRNYIVNSLRRLHWTVELHKFVDTVPVLGELTFHNIIAKLNPKAKRYLVLACHYDSKYMPDVEFVGATDSAVPCAMLLNLAEVLHAHLERFREESAEVSLMLLFFDGEEAFKQWGPTDSIYGARHLAKKWEKEGFLDSMDLLVLLDLLGTPDPKFYSFFENTEAWYSVLMDIEERLSSTGLMERYASSSVTNYDPHRYFQGNALRGSQVEDDHLPFLRRNVPVLHLIPMPFPSVWHTKDDNGSVIDYATTENLNRILRVFTIEYLMGSIEGELDYDEEMGQNKTN